MSADILLLWFPYVFPFFFLAMWLLSSTLLGFMSGWFNLQQWYADDGSEEPLLTLRGQSGRMGVGVALNRVLRLRTYPSGLGVGIWRIFAPFQKPLRIPWGEIDAESSSSFFVPMVKLHLGKPSNGTLKISARSWSRLVDAVPKGDSGTEFSMPAAPPVDAGSIAQGMFLQWVVISGVAAVFVFLTSRSGGGRGGVPLGICIGLPAAILGIGQIIRYARAS